MNLSEAPKYDDVSIEKGDNSDGGPRGTPEEPEKAAEYIKGATLALVMISISIVYFLNMLDTTVLATAIPYITDEFNSLLDIGWYGSAYTLATYWVFTGCLVVFEIGSVVCATARSSSTLIAGRVVAGLGGAGLLNGCLIIMNSSAPPHRTPALMGIVIGIGQLGLAFGPLIGGAFTEYVSWRWCFYINLIIGIPVAAIIAIVPIPDHIKKPAIRDAFKNGVMAFDVPGFAIFTCAVVMFFLALRFGGTHFAWNSSQIIGLFCGAGAALIAWLAWDWYAGEDAMVPYSMMEHRTVWVSCVCMAFQAAPVFSLTIFLPVYFQAVLGQTSFQSGVDFLATILPQLLFAVVGGRAVEKTGYYTPFLLVGVVLTTVGFGLMSMFSPDSPVGMWVGFQVIYGVGRGLSLAIVSHLIRSAYYSGFRLLSCLQPLRMTTDILATPQPFVAVQNTLPKQQIPAAMSIIMFIGNFAGAVAVVLSQTIFTNSLLELIPQYAPEVDPGVVIAAGSTKVREVVATSQIAQVLVAYAKSVDRTWYFTAAIAAVPFFFGWMLGFQDIRQKTKHEETSNGSNAA
ncbi:putative Major facilitator superfamily (MFS) profile domain-containing protein [Seiridium cardinale]|uniref:Major facilitator superfamily (MFS) profile domain-containing protein n=1 Tax=Seiridium cardinale TaxID=138064 RepID=A0ABR2XKB4_9PEZI